MTDPTGGGKADGPSDADPWFDITVLRAHVREDLTLRSFDHVQNCDKVADYWKTEYGQNVHYETFDCERYISGSVDATVFKPLPKWTFRNGQLQWMDLDAPLVVIETVTPLDRLERATHISFSESFLGGRIRSFIANGPDGQTREVEQVTLQDGRRGIVHRWIAAFERTGQSGPTILRTLPFKPALARDWDGQKTYYWDRLIGVGMFRDYIITNNRYNESQHAYELITPTSYDRTAEVL